MSCHDLRRGEAGDGRPEDLDQGLGGSWSAAQRRHGSNLSWAWRQSDSHQGREARDGGRREGQSWARRVGKVGCVNDRLVDPVVDVRQES